MSFSNKSNGRDFLSKSNSIPNNNQTGYRNSFTSAQHNYTGVNDKYYYDDKNQYSINIPKNAPESHGVVQNVSIKDMHYNTNNPRSKPHYQDKNYNDKHASYYNQQFGCLEDVVVPGIEQIRDFVKQQTERFKMELSRHESQQSTSSPSSHHQTEQSNYKYYKSYGSLGRSVTNNVPTSQSHGSITTSGSNAIPVSSMLPSCTDNFNRHPDARMGSNSFVVIKSDNNGFNYTKHSSQSSTKVLPVSLTRHASLDETSSKPTTIVKNDSSSNKAQFPSPTGSTAAKPEPKKAVYKTKPYSFVSGDDTAIRDVLNESKPAVPIAKINRPTMSDVVRNGFSVTRRSTTNENEGRVNHRVVEKLEERRHTLSHSDNTTNDNKEDSLCSTHSDNATVRDTRTIAV